MLNLISSNAWNSEKNKIKCKKPTKPTLSTMTILMCIYKLIKKLGIKQFPDKIGSSVKDF